MKEHIRILRSSAKNRLVGGKPPFSVFPDQSLVDQRAEIIVAQRNDLVEFVGSAEAVKEMQEWDTRLQCRGLCNKREISRLLNRVRAEHGKACGSGCHDVTVIAEDGKRVRCYGSRRDVDHRRG